MSDPLHVLERTRSVAVVGCSATPGKDAHDIPRFLLDHVELYPVNPSATEIFGKKVAASLDEVPRPIDLVNVFRPSAEAPAIARKAVEIGARALWLQTGIESAEARRIAEEAGLDYVENACIRVVMRQLASKRAREADERLVERFRLNL